MPGPRTEQNLQMPLELTDALLPGKILLKSKFDIPTHVETGFATHKHNYNKHQQWCIL